MATTSGNLGIKLMNPSGQDAGEILFNEAIQILDALGFGIPTVANTPPGSPANADIVLVGSSPTGVFAGHAGELAAFSNGTWSFFPLPVNGYATTEVALPMLREGEPVYSKVIDIAAGPNPAGTNPVNTAHGITGLDMSRPCDIVFYGYDGTTHVNSPVYLDSLSGWEVTVTATNVVWSSLGNDYSSFTGRAHLRYAK